MWGHVFENYIWLSASCEKPRPEWEGKTFTHCIHCWKEKP